MAVRGRLVPTLDCDRDAGSAAPGRPYPADGESTEYGVLRFGTRGVQFGSGATQQRIFSALVARLCGAGCPDWLRSRLGRLRLYLHVAEGECQPSHLRRERGICVCLLKRDPPLARHHLCRRAAAEIGAALALELRRMRDVVSKATRSAEGHANAAAEITRGLADYVVRSR